MSVNEFLNPEHEDDCIISYRYEAILDEIVHDLAVSDQLKCRKHRRG